MTPLRRIDAWLFSPGSAERLAAVRIGLCAALALRLTRGIYLELADQPQALYRPLSFMHAFDAMPPRAAVAAVQAIGVAAAVLAIVGLRARASLAVAWASGVFLGGMTTSIGKVMHNDVLLLLAMVPLLAAPVGDAWSLDRLMRPRAPRPGSYGWPVRTAMLVVACAYFLTGFEKLVTSGIAWATGDNLRWVLYTSSDRQAAPNALALFVADRAWLSRLAASGSLATEIAFPLAVASRRAAAVLVPAALGLHLGIRLAMGLDYWPWMATVAVVFVDWPVVVARVRARGSPAAALSRR